MRFLSHIAKSRGATIIVAYAVIGYLHLIRLTNRLFIHPQPYPDSVSHHMPAIFAIWHGQALILPLVFPGNVDLRVMISRNQEGEIGAIIARHFGIAVIRASGNSKSRKSATEIRNRGGVRGFLEMIKALKNGASVALSADVPKGPAHKVGLGILKLAQKSGAPIMPMSITSSRRHQLSSWDKAVISLPFGRIAYKIGAPIWVDSNGGEEAIANAQLALEVSLNQISQEVEGVASGLVDFS